MDELSISNPIDQERLSQLREAAGAGPVLILTHDNPDPDALASGMGLSTLFLQAWQIPNRMVFSGLVGRAENRAVLSLLTPDWQQEDSITDYSRYSALALVDTQPGAGNNRLAVGITPQIVIDHHYPRREVLRQVRYADVRPELGATASLIFQYLEAAGITPETRLATALFYGIQTDTQGLARNASHTDESIYMKLLGWIDRPRLARVEQAGLSREYFQAFSQGLRSAQVFGRAVIAYMGDLHQPDMAAEMADVLIRLESARAVLCLGVYRDQLNLSLRTEPSGQDAGLIVQAVIEHLGNAGGHGTIAGGQIQIENKDIDQMLAEIQQRFLKIMGETGKGSPLLKA